jgi:hypothetical protein
MEGDPHGFAHTSFRGPISSVPTAVRDPLFFMLHANVDRLWAKWQWVKRRANPADAAAYAPPSPNRIGHHLVDTMWPWNGVTGNPRPPTAPGGPFPPTAVTPLPGQTPTVEAMFDHLGVTNGTPLGYAYDDVPFELPPAVVAGGGAARTGTDSCALRSMVSKWRHCRRDCLGLGAHGVSPSSGYSLRRPPQSFRSSEALRPHRPRPHALRAPLRNACDSP